MTSIKSSIKVEHKEENLTVNNTVDDKGNFHTQRHRWEEKVEQ